MTKDEENELFATYKMFARMQFVELGEQSHKIIAAMMLAAVQEDRENDARRD